MQKILIAIDYAPSAPSVAELGYTLGKAMNAEIVLIHIIEDVGYYSSVTYDPIMAFGGFTSSFFAGTNVLETIEREAYEFLEKTKTYLNDNEIKSLVIYGNVADSILEIAKKEACDLIVVGTHSRNTLEELFLGSTAHDLLKRSEIPLYVVPIKTT